MRIPMKVDYGIRALVELAQHRTDGHVPTAEIARRQEIPEPYLDQLLGTLQKFGFIPEGGGPCPGQEPWRDQLGDGDGHPGRHG